MAEKMCEVPDAVTLALVQMSCSKDKQTNVEKAVSYIAAAAREGAHIVCLQELFASRYPCRHQDYQQFALAETIPGVTSKRLQEAAAEYHVVVVGSLFERRAAGLHHNAAAVFDAGGADLGIYRKMHIPHDPFYCEKFYFAPGDLGFRTFATRFGRLGVGICWDQWFPESARIMALQGAEILIYPTAIGWLSEEKETMGESQWNAWETIMRSHAIANGLFVAAVNRVGREGELEFWGSSFVTDPYGTVTKRGSRDQEELILVECRRGLLHAARTHWPFLRDRRIDAYGDLSKRFIDEP
ncbi:MAG: carbon-nitrogen hydrolase [Planctomycetota bacterium]